MLIKRFFWLLPILLFASLLGCNGTDTGSSYTIYGKTSEKEWDGNQIELCKKINGELVVVNQTKISNGHFKMKSTVDTAFIGMLRIPLEGLSYMQAVAVEPGKIQVLAGKETAVYGTPTNMKLQQLMLAIDSISALRVTIPADTFRVRFASFIQEQIAKNSDCPLLSEYIKESYIH